MVIWYDGSNFKSEDKILSAELINKTGKKITKKSHPYLYIGAGFDCETSRFANIDKPEKNLSTDYKVEFDRYKNALKSFVYVWQFSVADDTYLCSDIDLIIPFLNVLDSACERVHQNAKLMILDANISYEFSYFKTLLSPNIEKVFAKSQSDILTFSYLKHLEFRECIGAFGSSLADIAKKHTKTQKLKGDLDYSLIRIPGITPITSAEQNYCINDVQILSELCLIAHDTYTRKGKKIPLTLTGIVRDEIISAYVKNNYIKRSINADVQRLIGTESEYNLFRNYVYSGGLPHSNFEYVGIKLNNVTCYDLTSAYPWALNTKYYPAGDLIHCGKDNISDAFKHKHYMFKALIKSVKSKSSHSTISKHKVLKYQNAIIDNGRIYRADYLILWFTEIDFENFNMIYDYDRDNSKILDAYYFTKSARVPSAILDVMNTWYKKKQILKPLVSDEHKNDKDYTENVKEYKRLKSLINSVYGMFVTRLYDTEMIFNKETSELTEVKKPWSDVITSAIFNPYWGYYCTAYVRQRLIECISKFPDKIVQYDTDSIYCLPDNALTAYIQQINKNILSDNKTKIHVLECLDLGMWDNDGFYKNFICLGSKRYIGQHTDGTYKITFAGGVERDIIAESKNKNMDLFDYIINFDIPEKNSTKTGAYHFDGFYQTYVTDYLGNTALVKTYGGTTVKTVDFKASLSENYEHLRQVYGGHDIDNFRKLIENKN